MPKAYNFDSIFTSIVISKLWFVLYMDNSMRREESVLNEYCKSKNIIIINQNISSDIVTVHTAVGVAFV